MICGTMVWGLGWRGELRKFKTGGKSRDRHGPLIFVIAARPRLAPLPDRIALFGKGAGAFQLILR